MSDTACNCSSLGAFTSKCQETPGYWRIQSKCRETWGHELQQINRWWHAVPACSTMKCLCMQEGGVRTLFIRSNITESLFSGNMWGIATGKFCHIATSHPRRKESHFLVDYPISSLIGFFFYDGLIFILSSCAQRCARSLNTRCECAYIYQSNVSVMVMGYFYAAVWVSGILMSFCIMVYYLRFIY